LADEISFNFEDITIERKYTSDKKILAGITIDYRHLKDWRSHKENLEPALEEMIEKKRSSSGESKSKPTLNVQTYASHPFIDVYAIKCDKGLAFDYISPMISTIGRKGKGAQNIMYLGDSENDNPAFRKADLPIGIKSDERLNPTLDCKYYLELDELSTFFKGLMHNNFVFSDNLKTNIHFLSDT
jgi:hydroxymethylpyrimidine pyrophosphatase-like HAD family hydrolase